jgi:hypothetical protein
MQTVQQQVAFRPHPQMLLAAQPQCPVRNPDRLADFRDIERFPGFSSTTLRNRRMISSWCRRFRCRLSPPDRLARADQPGKIERFGRYGDRSFSRATQRRHLRRGRNSRRVIRSLIGSAENSASCRKRICPLTSRIIHLTFASRSGHHTPICAFSCPRVGSFFPLIHREAD